MLFSILFATTRTSSFQLTVACPKNTSAKVKVDRNFSYSLQEKKLCLVKYGRVSIQMRNRQIC